MPTFTFALGRALSIILGALSAFGLTLFFFPVRASKRINLLLAEVMQKTGFAIDHFVDIYLQSLQVSQAECTPLEAAGGSKLHLVSEVLAPTMAAETLLNTETTLWKRGPLGTDKQAVFFVRAMKAEFRSLPAMQMVLERQPVLTGRYGNARGENTTFLRFIQPLEVQIRNLRRAAYELCSACVTRIQSNFHGHIADIDACVAMLRVCRFEFAHQFNKQRKAMHQDQHHAMSQSSLGDPATGFDSRNMIFSPDDAVLLHSFYHSWMAALNSLTALALAICADEMPENRTKEESPRRASLITSV